MTKNYKYLLAATMMSMLLASCENTAKSEEISQSTQEVSDKSSTKEQESIETSSVEPIQPSESSNQDETPKSYTRTRQEMPTAKIIDNNNDYGDESTWAGDKYSSVDLGYVYLQDVIDDTVYDWGHSVIYEDGVYKMWWVRPAVYDAIFYAESTDLKNWTNVQRVIALSPNSLNVKKYDNIKGMLGKPSVIHVDDTYFMYFEAPATEDPDVTQTVLEWDNQVMLATSKDGIEWSFYSDEKGQPKPVVAMEPQFMKDGTNKNYGSGQPSVFYKDGVFYLTYCYVLYANGGKTNGIYVATSTDGYDFGDISTHKYVSSGNGCGITFNEKTNKYMMARADTVVESDTLDFTSGKNYKFDNYQQNVIQRGFAEFIKNPHGLVDTETFYVIYLQGDKSTTNDWRAGYATWDGHITAVNPCEYQNRPITLPNGAMATDANLAEYRDRTQKYSRPTADAIYAGDADIKIDGEKDDIYNQATKIEISRPVYNYGSNFTDSFGEAYLAWDEENLYLFAHIYDSIRDVSYPILDDKSIYMHDSLDVFVDVPNDHGIEVEVPYGIEQYMISTDANNQGFIIKGSGEYDLTSEFTGVRHRVKTTEHGYDVEFKVPWHELVVDLIEENKCIGIDFQINDSMGHDVGREALVAWADHTGNSFRFTDQMGDVYLIKK